MKRTAEDLACFAEDLPNECVGLSSDARSRLLCVLEILRTYTDADHGLTAAEIREIIRARSGAAVRPSEPAVLDDLHAIVENQPMGHVVQAPTRGQSLGFRCVDRPISSAQARLLINIVRTCRFITDEQNRELCDALTSLVSYSEQDKIVGGVYVDERVRPDQPNVFAAVDVISAALNQGKMVEFDYCYYGLDGKEHLWHASDGETRFAETPVDLVYSFDQYYLEAWNEEERRVNNRRLDRVRNISVSSKDAIDGDFIAEHRRMVKNRLMQTFDMMACDEGTCELFLEVDAVMSNVVFNRFGFSCAFENIVESSEGTQKGCMRIVVYPSKTFYRWLAGAGGKIRIVEPKDDIWIRMGSWAQLPTAGRTLEQLRQDYERAALGYRAFLSDAAQVLAE